MILLPQMMRLVVLWQLCSHSNAQHVGLAMCCCACCSQAAILYIRMSMQACHWTGDCTTAGCANKCIANLFIATNVFLNATDAAWANDRFTAICTAIPKLLYAYSRQSNVVGTSSSLPSRRMLFKRASAESRTALMRSELPAVQNTHRVLAQSTNTFDLVCQRFLTVAEVKVQTL